MANGEGFHLAQDLISLSLGPILILMGIIPLGRNRFVDGLSHLDTALKARERRHNLCEAGRICLPYDEPSRTHPLN